MGSMRCGQHIFRSDNKEDGHTCCFFEILYVVLSVCFAGSVRSTEAEYISSQCAADLTASSTTSGMAPPTTRSADVLVRPVAVKLPLRVVSDRMNVDAGVEWPSRLAGKPAGVVGARDVNRFPLSINENVTGETAEEMWSAQYDGDAHSNSDDEVCDVFSRARRLQAAAAVSGWLSCDVADGRRCIRLLRAAAALATGGAAMARSTRWNGLPRRWLHDSRTSAVMNAVELPRPFLDFAKMQVRSQWTFIYCRTEHRTTQKQTVVIGQKDGLVQLPKYVSHTLPESEAKPNV